MRIRLSYVLAAALAAGISWYMLTGKTLVGGQADNGYPSIAERQQAAAEPVAVQVELHEAEERTARLEVRGRTQAAALVEVRAQTAGTVEARPVEKGRAVAPGDLLCVIERGAREARLAQARAQLQQAEVDFEARSTLVERGHAPRNQLPPLQAALDAARAAVAETELELSRTEVRAPVAGIVQDPLASVGDVVQVGGTCATLIDSDPMKVTGQVSERQVGLLGEGMPAAVALVTGERAEGTIAYIAPSADPQTRTFRIEIEVANPDGRIRDGVTALAQIPLPGTRAHLVSSAYLTLDDSGAIGLRLVDDSDIARFVPVEIVGSDSHGLWVAGLPDEARIITVGQEYVADGERVAPQPPRGAPLKPARAEAPGPESAGAGL